MHFGPAVEIVGVAQGPLSFRLVYSELLQSGKHSMMTVRKDIESPL